MISRNAVLEQVRAGLILLILLLTPLDAYATDAIKTDPIKIITYTDYPPYLYHENGQMTGIYMRIVALTLDAIGQPFTVETLPFKRALLQASTGKGIMIGVLKTEERIKTLDFSEPIYQERVSVFFNEQKKPLFQSVNQLDGLTVGTILGWSYGVAFDAGRKENRFVAKNGEIESSFYLLSIGRLDAVVHTELSSLHILKILGLTNEVFLGSEPLEIANIHIAGKKDAFQELLERFNQKQKEPDHLKKIQLIIESYTK